MDIKELFETQIPIGPEHRPMTDRIASGRRALQRRRRASVGAASVAVVAVVGLVGAVVNVGDLRSDRDNPPTTSTSSPTASPTYTPPPPDEELTRSIAVKTDWLGDCVEDPEPDAREVACWQDMLQRGRAGKVWRREDVQVNQRIDLPSGEGTAEDVVALEATYHGVTGWYYFGLHENTVGDPDESEEPTFAEWAAFIHRHALKEEDLLPEYKEADGTTRPGVVWIATDGRVMITPGAEVVDRIDDPMGYGDAGVSVAVAAKVDGVEWWHLEANGPGSHAAVSRADGGDFQDWVDEQVEQFHSGHTGLAFDDSGRIVSTADDVKVVDQVADPDIDWIAEPGAHSALVEYRDFRGRGFVLLRTRNQVFDGAVETISFRYHPEKDTLQTILARLQKENRP